MKKYFISYVVESLGYEGNVKVWECKNNKDCFIKILDHFNGLDEDFNEEDYGEESLEEMLDSVQSENCGEWMIVSIISEGKIIYTF